MGMIVENSIDNPDSVMTNILKPPPFLSVNQ